MKVTTAANTALQSRSLMAPSNQTGLAALQPACRSPRGSIRVIAEALS